MCVCVCERERERQRDRERKTVFLGDSCVPTYDIGTNCSLTDPKGVTVPTPHYSRMVQSACA